MENSDPYFLFKNANMKCSKKYYMFFLHDNLLVRCNFDTYFLTFTIEMHQVNFSVVIFIKNKTNNKMNDIHSEWQEFSFW